MLACTGLIMVRVFISDYPWRFPSSFTDSNVVKWLYIPDFRSRPNSSFLVCRCFFFFKSNRGFVCRRSKKFSSVSLLSRSGGIGLTAQQSTDEKLSYDSTRIVQQKHNNITKRVILFLCACVGTTTLNL